MRIIIAGGRDFVPSSDDYRIIQDILTRKADEVVSGGCRGADRFGEECADNLGLPNKVFNADWNKHGRAAGPIRNRQMAEYADAAILMPGGRGTDSMRAEMERVNKPILYDAN